jgi:hypothetical protein
MNLDRGTKGAESAADAMDPMRWRFGRAREEFDLRRIDLTSLAMDFSVHSREYCERVTGVDLTGVAVEDFHRHIPVDMQTPNDVNINACTHLIQEAEDAALYRDYIRVLLHISYEVLGSDLVFESKPFLRLHFPQPMPSHFRLANGEMACYHNDMMFGEYAEQFNCWLSITRCRASSGLQVASLADSCRIVDRFVDSLGLTAHDFAESRPRFFEWMRDDEDAYRFVKERVSPMQSEANELVMFHPLKIHGTAENIEDTTRSSIDFRIMPLDDYDRVIRQASENADKITTFDGMVYVRGDYYHSATIREYARAHGLEGGVR